MRSQYIRPKVTIHKYAETIQGRKLFKGGNYSRKYGMYFDAAVGFVTKPSHLFRLAVAILWSVIKVSNN